MRRQGLIGIVGGTINEWNRPDLAALETLPHAKRIVRAEVQLWEITLESLPQDLQEALISTTNLTVKNIINAAREKGYKIYLKGV